MKEDILDADMEISMDTKLADIEEWDSLAHVQLIEKIEAVLGVKFSAKEMMSWDEVGELVDSIEEKLK